MHVFLRQNHWESFEELQRLRGTPQTGVSSPFRPEPRVTSDRLLFLLKQSVATKLSAMDRESIRQSSPQSNPKKWEECGQRRNLSPETLPASAAHLRWRTATPAGNPDMKSAVLYALEETLDVSHPTSLRSFLAFNDIFSFSGVCLPFFLVVSSFVLAPRFSRRRRLQYNLWCYVRLSTGGQPTTARKRSNTSGKK